MRIFRILNIRIHNKWHLCKQISFNEVVLKWKELAFILKVPFPFITKSNNTRRLSFIIEYLLGVLIRKELGEL